MGFPIKLIMQKPPPPTPDASPIPKPKAAAEHFLPRLFCWAAGHLYYRMRTKNVSQPCCPVRFRFFVRDG